MRKGLEWAICLAVLAISATLSAQSHVAVRSRAQSILSSGSLALNSESVLGTQAPGVAPGELVPGEIVREIDDPHTGDRWLLLRNAEAPGGPGRLVRIAVRRESFSGTTRPSAHSSEETTLLPAIHSGDRLTVVEHTARVDTTLEAYALAPAAVGGTLDVRLAIGGRVVRVVALGTGRAVIQPETGEQP